MIYVFWLASLALLSILCGLVMLRDKGQRALDAARKYYSVTFPSDMDEKNVQAFIRAIGSNLRGGSTYRGVPTIVFEVWSDSTGITHRLRVPEDDSTYLIGQLQSSLSGIEINEIVSDNRDATRQYSTILETDNPHSFGGFQFGATLHMQNASEELPIVNAIDYSHRILASLQDATQEHDAICVQWVIAHSDHQKAPPSDRPINSNRTSLFKLLVGDTQAGRDEVKTRRNKQLDQVYLATARIAARGVKVGRAEQLVRQVVRAYTSESGFAHFYAKGVNPRQVSEDIHLARTPLMLTALVSVKELASVIAWPLSDMYVPGLNRGTTRHMPASESVPRGGRILGETTMPGVSRQIAMSYESAASHIYVAGNTGTGKSTLLVNAVRQDMENGAGVVLIERDGNLFSKALDQVPPHRINDVICIDLTRTDRPVGLNLLRLGKPEIVAGQLATLLDALYPNNKSLYSNQLVQQGIPVLAKLPRATIADLIPLVHPQNPVEKQWAREVTKGNDFWQQWYKDEKQMALNSQPLKNRMWEVLTPEPIRNLVNQETSSFNPVDVIQGNKLLFVNLAGVSEQAASLIGTMIVTAIWTAAKTTIPSKANFMYLDEFQQFSYLSNDFTDMLATARKRNLGLVMATQYIERLKQGMQDAVMANARTKVIFQSSANSSKIHAVDFASPHVKKESFMNLPAHMALARVNTDVGVSPPMTLQTFPERPGYGNGQNILDLSAVRYGRDQAAIQRDDETRRRVEQSEPVTRKQIGRSGYDAGA